MLTIRYEDLVTDLDGQLSRLGDFLDEDFSTSSGSWYEHAKLRHSKNWFHELLLPHSRSVGRWQDPAFRTVVDELMAMPEAIRLLDHFGYETRAVPSRAQG